MLVETRTQPSKPACADAQRLALTVGPVQYHWPRAALMAFYADIAESNADTVVLGEAVCARRRELKPEDWMDLARDLQTAGKEVVLVTQTLIESESDLRALRRLAEQREFIVEAGDASALQLLADTVPFVLGPHINIYNRAALVEHAALGALRWVAPAELSLDALAHINPPRDPVLSIHAQPLATEVFAFGRLPLAFSARCFTARHHGLNKDECEFRCLDDPDGMLLSSSEGQPFLVLNGTQTQSAAVQCLLADGAALRAAGVQRVRLSPCAQGFGEVLRDFDAVLNGAAPAAPALARWPGLGVPGPLSNGYARRRPGMDWSLS